MSLGNQQTSIDAFTSIRKELSTRQAAVYNAIKQLKNCTNLEISDYLKIPINQVTPRTNELVKEKYVRESGYKRSEVTHKMSITWSIIEGS